MKKKILFVYQEDNRMADLNYFLHSFTINNGCYPDVIEMTTEALNRYIALLFEPPQDRKKTTFNGIKIKELNL